MLEGLRAISIGDMACSYAGPSAKSTMAQRPERGRRMVEANSNKKTRWVPRDKMFLRREQFYSLKCFC